MVRYELVSCERKSKRKSLHFTFFLSLFRGYALSTLNANESSVFSPNLPALDFSRALACHLRWPLTLCEPEKKVLRRFCSCIMPQTDDRIE